MTVEKSPAKARLPLKVLIADDEPVVRRCMGRVLRRRIRELDMVVDGQEALDRLLGSTDPYDIVLSDLAMPRLSGIELARRLKPLEHAPPVVLMTAYDPPEVQQLLDEGILAGFLRKPTPLSQLLDILARHARPAP